MDGRLVRAVGALVALLALAGVIGVAANLVLAALRAPTGLSTPVVIAVAVTVILPLADAYTLLGRGVDTDALRERGRSRLVAEIVFAAIGSFAVSGLLAAAVFVKGDVWSFTLVVVTGVAAGYGTFVLRNRAYYGG